jgi:DtxR family Mn-dependent transcriptional regulator
MASVASPTVAVNPHSAERLAALNLGAAAEDYLLTVAAIAETDGAVTGAQVARLLGVSEPSVTQMIHRLAQAGLVAPRAAGRAAGQAAARSSDAGIAPPAARRRDGAAPRSGGIRLTPAGGAAGAWLLLRRRVCESFFVDGIGLDWASALEAADRMEHALTLDGVRQLHRTLGAPTTCPHGNRLWLDGDTPGDPPRAQEDASTPRAEPAEADDVAGPRLREVAAGAAVVVERLCGAVEQDPTALPYLQRHGITPGATVILEESAPLTDARIVQSGGQRCTLAAALAAQIVVREAPAVRQDEACLAAPAPCRQSGAVLVTAVRVEGPCESGHRPGDRFLLDRQTPAGLCSATYASLLPCVQRALTVGSGGTTSEPIEPAERRCPGDGFVTWRVEQVDAGTIGDTGASGNAGAGDGG